MNSRQKWLSLIGAVIAVGLMLLLRYQPAVHRAIVDFWSPYVEARESLEHRSAEAQRLNLSKIELVTEINRLEEELKNADIHARRLERLERENLDLRLALRLGAPAEYATILARVISRDPAAGGRRLRIDRGSTDGILVGQPVTTQGKLLGRVAEVASHSAVILTLADPACHISTRFTVQNRSVYGTLTGRGEDAFRAVPLCRVDHLPRDFDYPAGLELETSGYSHVIPAGIPIGITYDPKVEDMVVTHDGLYKSVLVRPYAFEVDYVYVSVWRRYIPATTTELAAPPDRPLGIDAVRPVAPVAPEFPDPTQDPPVPDEP